MICPVCNATVRPGVLFCPRCGRDIAPATTQTQTNPIVRVPPTLADQGIVSIETSRTAAIREFGDVVKVRDVVSMQSGVVCDWLATRQAGKGVSIRQEISVGGRVFRRTLRASIIVKTW